MPQSLKQKPWFVLLLPLFFVIHGYAEHYAFIGIRDIFYLLVSYCIATLVIFLFFQLIFRNAGKAALMTTTLMSVYLFYGALFDFLKAHSPIKGLHRYSILLSILTVGSIAMFIYLKKTKKPLTRPIFFLNILFLIYLGIDLATIGWKAIYLDSNKMSNYSFARQNIMHIPDSCKKPDIYFIIFDEYGSSRFLKERFGYVNDLDSFLLSRQFALQENSIGNYNFTSFSMASILNMDYLHIANRPDKIERYDFLNCNPQIEKNQVIKFLGMNGYTIVNLSIFDLAGSPSIVQQSLLPVKTRMITEGTLFARVYRDFEWYFFSNKLLAKLFRKAPYTFLVHRANNATFYKELIQQSTIKTKEPRFIYTHFVMPHFPHFFDHYGNQKSDSTLLREAMYPNPATYVDYVRYVNGKIRELVDTIQKNTNSSAAIILLGDHGYREKNDTSINVFRNLNATYFPNKNYSQFYSNMSNVNYFRITFNSLFNQHIPLIKDSTTFLSGN